MYIMCINFEYTFNNYKKELLNVLALGLGCPTPNKIVRFWKLCVMLPNFVRLIH